MLYEYRHFGRRRRGWPKTFELIRSSSQRDDAAPCPKCASLETERIKFQAFSMAGGSDADAGGSSPRPPGSGPYDDFTAANMPDDLDSDVASR